MPKRKAKEVEESALAMKPKEMGGEEEETIKYFDARCSDGSDSDSRAQELASEFPELVRFKNQDLPELLHEADLE